MVGPNKKLANVVQCTSAVRRALKKMERRLLELLMEIVAEVIVDRRVG
jgi:DNA-binding FrmR family transcriptional regulator